MNENTTEPMPVLPETSSSTISPETVDDSYEQRIADIADEAELTKREREVMEFLARGRSAKYIADALVISQNTVWSHVKRVYAKTGVSSKQELIDLVEAPEVMIHRD